MRRELLGSIGGVLVLAVTAAWVPSLKANTSEAAESLLIPKTVLVSAQINADDSLGPETRSLFVMDLETDELWNFPFSSLPGGPVEGQAMHAIVTPDKRTVYLTMGGNDELPLRLVTLSLSWKNGKPTPKVIASREFVASGNGMQEAHGVRVSPDGRYLMFSELQNGRLRIFDIEKDRFVGEPISHPSLQPPHGLWPSPSGTRAASTQYMIDGRDVSIWRFDPSTGALAFDKTVALEDPSKKARGAYSHTISWLDALRFFTNATQEADQGTAHSSEQSVWLVDADAGTAKAVLGSGDLLEGASDHVIANGKLYVCEGNFAQTEPVPPGYISIWDIADPSAPKIEVVRRRSSRPTEPRSVSRLPRHSWPFVRRTGLDASR